MSEETISPGVRDSYPMQKVGRPCDNLCGIFTKRWVFDPNRFIYICWSCHSQEQKNYRKTPEINQALGCNE